MDYFSHIYSFSYDFRVELYPIDLFMWVPNGGDTVSRMSDNIEILRIFNTPSMIESDKKFFINSCKEGAIFDNLYFKISPIIAVKLYERFSICVSNQLHSKTYSQNRFIRFLNKFYFFTKLFWVLLYLIYFSSREDNRIILLVDI